MSTCDVILAVWNGQNYLPAMLDSLLGQTTSDFNVLVRDDGSTDGSREILESYKPRFDGRLSVIKGEPSGGATANFAILMRETKADYVLFADQDDVWKPEKVELTLRSLKEAEAKYGKSTPIYFATDIAVVNKDLEVISPSYWKWKRLKPSMMSKLSQSLICVPISGHGLGNKSSPLGPGKSGRGEGHQSRLVGTAHCRGDGESHLRSHSHRTV